MNDSTPDVRSRQQKPTRTGCAVEATLSVIGGIWKPVLVFHLLESKLRFNALCRRVPAATPRMITMHLRELEADRIIERTVFPEVPPKVEYELTTLGKSLAPVLLSMRDWGERLQKTTSGDGCLSQCLTAGFPHSGCRKDVGRRLHR